MRSPSNLAGSGHADPLAGQAAGDPPIRTCSIDPSVSTALLLALWRFSDASVILATGFVVFRLHPAAFEPALAPYVIAIAAAALAIVALQDRFQVYDIHLLARHATDLRTPVLSWGIVAASLLAAAFLLKVSDGISRVWMVAWSCAGLLGLQAVRASLHCLARHWIARGNLRHVVAVLGDPILGERTLRFLAERSPHWHLIGVFHDGSERGRSLDDLVSMVRRRQVHEIVVALPWSAQPRIDAVVRTLSALPIDVRLAPELPANGRAALSYTPVAGIPMLDICSRPLKPGKYVAKFLEDQIIAVLLLAFLLPLFGVIALAVRLDSPGPVFFRQTRLGFNNQQIRIWKFRTMHHHARDERADRLASRGDPRVTRVGVLLRKTSLDELPQLFNVLRGEMSLVGPRPHALGARAEHHLYWDVVENYHARHRVKPGITGWAQVSGWRGPTDTEEELRQRVAHDLHYIENWTLLFDLKILVLTVFAVLRMKNAC